MCMQSSSSYQFQVSKEYTRGPVSICILPCYLFTPECIPLPRFTCQLASSCPELWAAVVAPSPIAGSAQAYAELTPILKPAESITTCFMKNFVMFSTDAGPACLNLAFLLLNSCVHLHERNTYITKYIIMLLFIWLLFSFLV